MDGKAITHLTPHKMDPRKTLKCFAGLLALVLALAWVAGCKTPDPAGVRYNPILGTESASNLVKLAATYTTNYTLQVGDELTVTFQDINPPLAPITAKINED